MDVIPQLGEALIDELERLYPPITPAMIRHGTDKELAFLAGQRDVVDKLLMVRERTRDEEQT